MFFTQRSLSLWILREVMPCQIPSNVSFLQYFFWIAWIVIASANTAAIMWQDFDSTPQDEYEWLSYVTIITCNILQRTIFDVNFPSHERKAANNSKTAQFHEQYQLHAAAILFSFALITHDPPTSAKSSIGLRTLVRKRTSNSYNISSFWICLRLINAWEHIKS